MYKVSIILLSALIYFLVGILVEQKTSPKIVAKNISTITPTPKQEIVLPQVGSPVILEIPKLQIKSSIEYIGVNAEGKLGVPQDFFNTGWYSFGYKPGENGNAVIAGHYDTITGAPAVFYYLSSLEVGDEIRITDDKNKVYTFLVTLKELYDYDKAPLKELFAPNNKPRLNLITCSGLFDYVSQNYLQRIVIYSEMPEISPENILSSR